MPQTGLIIFSFHVIFLSFDYRELMILWLLLSLLSNATRFLKFQSASGILGHVGHDKCTLLEH